MIQHQTSSSSIAIEAFPAIHAKINLVSIAVAKSTQLPTARSPLTTKLMTRKQANRTQCSGTPQLALHTPASMPHHARLRTETPLHIYAHNAELLCKFQVTLISGKKKFLLTPVDGALLYAQPRLLGDIRDAKPS